MRSSTWQLTIAEDAELDIIEGYVWYEEQKAGLGDSFLKELDAAFAKITNNPEYYHLSDKNTRVCQIRTYPFSVVYALHQNTIQVVAVFHTSRNPTDWLDREFSH